MIDLPSSSWEIGALSSKQESVLLSIDRGPRTVTKDGHRVAVIMRPDDFLELILRSRQ